MRATRDQREAATQAVLRLLDLAEQYYRSAAHGLRFIPLRQRLAVLVAARIYRAIGLQIIRDPMRIWAGTDHCLQWRKGRPKRVCAH